MKYLPLYYEWMETKEIPYAHCNGMAGGLCGLFDDHKLFKLMKPRKDELKTTMIWGYWGWDEIDTDHYESRAYAFNTLRQNIVLLMAAMNNEL